MSSSPIFYIQMIWGLKDTKPPTIWSKGRQGLAANDRFHGARTHKFFRLRTFFYGIHIMAIKEGFDIG
ncbi:hypothetical protein BXT84_00165 [Sulfobacillus thermotolerans]|uniref:Uncharacterized protein n=1 Tax=Sulfobacillus thermotolerans TaxID=338644 RepID=A0ABN5GVT2_9FIRM|nr:hypothetical protein BXT84_00165 [Sulfobacillus thermotolerans]